MKFALKKEKSTLFRVELDMQPLTQKEFKEFLKTLEKEAELWGATECVYKERKGEIQIVFNSVLKVMQFKKLF